ncbi:MAG: hypothetical protein RIG62_29675 [Cyclobacteriaceae bacterium]
MNIANLSQKELMYRVEVAVEAALRIPELQTVLQEHGLSADKAKVGLSLIKEVTIWQKRQNDTQQNAADTQNTLRQVRDSIDAIYRRHRVPARFVYREDPKMLKKLQLHKPRQIRYTDWLEQVLALYDNLDSNEISGFGILPKEISEVKKLVGQLTELNVLRNDARRQAQQATHAKQMAVHDLRQWFRRFIRASEFACQDDPQMLESMGVVVASK